MAATLSQSSDMLSEPKPIPSIPPPPDVLSKDQWDVLIAVVDAFVPSIVRAGEAPSPNQISLPNDEYDDLVRDIRPRTRQPPSNRSLDSYLAESPSQIPDFKEYFGRFLVHSSRPDARKAFMTLLTILSTRAGSLALTGYVTPLKDQPVNVRISIFKSWEASYFPPIRLIGQQLCRLSRFTWLCISPTVEIGTGFPRLPYKGKRGKNLDYSFLQFQSSPTPHVIETDVVVVGSGCGGGVVARNLSLRGYKVIVVEKGYHHDPEVFPMTERDAFMHLYDNGLARGSDDNSISTIAGSTWGGGGSVNWSGSMQPQHFVRREWAREHDLPFFESRAFQKSLDDVCDLMGVGTKQIEHNFANKALLESSRKLGLTAKAIPQNTAGNAHNCGHCTLGCASAEKQGPAVKTLADAAKLGATFIEGFTVDRVVFETDAEADRKKAIGVVGQWKSNTTSGPSADSDAVKCEVFIRARKVVMSAGALWSPIVLKRSGLNVSDPVDLLFALKLTENQNPNIGQNLHLHPVNYVGAYYDEEVNPWDGASMTSVCSSLENLDGKGHGVKLEVPVMIPTWFLIQLNWEGGVEWKKLCTKMRNMCGFFSMARDRDSGSVYEDPVDHCPRIKYTPSKFDRLHVLRGSLELCRVARTSGAREIYSTVPGIPTFHCMKGETDTSTNLSDEYEEAARFEKWLTNMEYVGRRYPAPFGSAHQMGTCRMSSSPQKGVVNPKGRVWGTEDLYVADASVLPSASGVNPMVTTLGISDWIAKNVVADLEEGGNGHVGKVNGI